MPLYGGEESGGRWFYSAKHPSAQTGDIVDDQYHELDEFISDEDFVAIMVKTMRSKRIGNKWRTR